MSVLMPSFISFTFIYCTSTYEEQEMTIISTLREGMHFVKLIVVNFEIYAALLSCMFAIL